MAVAKNDITGDSIQTRANSTEFEKNWDNIFPDWEAKLAEKRKENSEYWAKVKAETEARLAAEQK
jgi:hypothetical protein